MKAVEILAYSAVLNGQKKEFRKEESWIGQRRLGAMKTVVRRIQFPAQPVSYRKDWFRNLRPSFSRDGKKRTCRHRVAGHEAQELAKEAIAPYSIERVTESRIHIIAVRQCVSLNSRDTFPKFLLLG